MTWDNVDELGYRFIEDDQQMHVHDLHATMRYLCGIDHKRLTYRYQGRDFRLTDVSGKVADGILVCSAGPEPKNPHFAVAVETAVAETRAGSISPPPKRLVSGEVAGRNFSYARIRCPPRLPKTGLSTLIGAHGWRFGEVQTVDNPLDRWLGNGSRLVYCLFERSACLGP